MRTRRIVIVGGGVVGSSIAWHLARASAASDVVVIEPDPTYAHAATPRATGTVRRVFSLAKNIEMSACAHEIYGVDPEQEQSAARHCAPSPARPPRREAR